MTDGEGFGLTPNPSIGGLPSPPDVNDAVQREAHGAAREAVRLVLAAGDEVWEPGPAPSFHERCTFHAFYLAIELMAATLALLRPHERTYLYAHAASMPLRALADLYACYLAVWTAPDPAERLDRWLADSLKDQLRAANAADVAGLDVAAIREHVQRRLQTLEPGGATDFARGVNVANTLEQTGELDLATVFRWESGLLHHGDPVLGARGRRVLTTAGTEADVVGWPISLWRVGQLTWAAYGVGLRTLTCLGARIGMATQSVRKWDETARSTVRAGAQRDMDEDEPPAPRYADLEFPLWN